VIEISMKAFLSNVYANNQGEAFAHKYFGLNFGLNNLMSTGIGRSIRA